MKRDADHAPESGNVADRTERSPGRHAGGAVGPEQRSAGRSEDNERPPEVAAAVAAAAAAAVKDGDEDDVPRLPRGRGLRLSRPQMVRIAGTLFLLVFLIVVQHPCADAVSKLVTGFGDHGSPSAQMPRPGTVDMPGPAGSGGSTGSAGSGGRAASTDGYEHLRPGMTEEEIKAVIERARIRAAGGAVAP